MARFPVRDWLAQQVRITVFPVGPLPDPDTRPRWWADTVDAEPEARVAKPRAGSLEEAGPYEVDGLNPSRLVLATEATRIDWRLLPVPTPSHTIDVVGPFPEAMNAMVALAIRWLARPDVPPLKRVAIGADAIHPEASRQDGYRRLVDYLPAVQIDPEGSEDFLYRINRRRRLRIDGEELFINRLSKWTTAKTTFMDLGAAAGVTEPSTQFVTRMELDINTPAERTEALPQGLMNTLMRSLVDLSLEVAERGDIP